MRSERQALVAIQKLLDEGPFSEDEWLDSEEVRAILADVQPEHEHDWRNRVGGGSLCRTCNTWQDRRVPEPAPDPRLAEIAELVDNYELIEARRIAEILEGP